MFAPLEYSCLGDNLQNYTATGSQALLVTSSFWFKVGMSKNVLMWHFIIKVNVMMIHVHKMDYN